MAVEVLLGAKTMTNNHAVDLAMLGPPMVLLVTAISCRAAVDVQPDWLVIVAAVVVGTVAAVAIVATSFVRMLCIAVVPVHWRLRHYCC